MKSTMIKRRFHEYRAFTTRCKPLVTHLQELAQFRKKKPWKNETKMNAYQYEQKRKQWWRRENAHDPKHNPPSVKHVRWLFTANAILTCTACITVCSITYWLIDLYCNKIIIQWFIDLTVFLKTEVVLTKIFHFQ